MSASKTAAQSESFLIGHWYDDAGLGAQHAASVVSLAATSNYYGHPSNEQNLSGVNHGGGAHSPGKYQENGHDTFSDFVTLVCQEAQNTQNAQVTSSLIHLLGFYNFQPLTTHQHRIFALVQFRYLSRKCYNAGLLSVQLLWPKALPLDE